MDATAQAKPSRTLRRSTNRKPAALAAGSVPAASHESSKASPEAPFCSTAKEPKRASVCSSVVTKASISEESRLSTKDSRSSGASIRSPSRAAISPAWEFAMVEVSGEAPFARSSSFFKLASSLLTSERCWRASVSRARSSSRARWQDQWYPSRPRGAGPSR